MEQLNRVKDLSIPEFGTLQAWEAQASAAGRAAGDSSSNDPSKSSQGYGGTPMPFLGDTKVTFFSNIFSLSFCTLMLGIGCYNSPGICVVCC